MRQCLGDDGDDERYSLRLVELEPIRDDASKVLTTRRRFHGIDAWTSEVWVLATMLPDGRRGVRLELTLDAPAPGATSIELVKGQGELRHVKIVPLPRVHFRPFVVQLFPFEFKALELP